MVDLGDVSLIVLLFGVFAFWWRTHQIRLLALQYVTRQCKQRGLQLLDQTVALKDIRPVRSGSSMGIQRRYQFEFTSNGDQRYLGTVYMLGNTLERCEFAAHLMPEQPQD